MQDLFRNTFSVRGIAVLIVWLVCLVPVPGQTMTVSLAKTALPPLAWSSWNSFSNTVNSDITMRQAKAMIASGLQKAGYEYVNIDEGWWMGDRDAEGNIVVDPKMWPAIAAGEKPGDMTNIVRYLHSQGLKAGIYTDAGKDGCSMYPDLGPAYFHEGSESHYDQDFLQFARWGFDYVKVDWCGGEKENLSGDVQYGEIARAISRAEQITGKHLYYSICNWGRQSPWTWAPGVGGATQDVWRVSEDIVAPIVANSVNAGRKAGFEKMLRNFDQGIHPEAQHTGFYNDPDMMVLGMPGLNAEQNRLHLALWAVSGAPLIIGADLTTLDAETSKTLLNPEVIAIDQDALGLQGVQVKEISAGLEIWSKFLSTPGSRAVVLLNRTYFPAPMSLDWASLGLTGESATVRDVWAGKDLGSVNGRFTATVPAQGGTLLVIRGSEGRFAHYTPSKGPIEQEKGITDPQTTFTVVSQTPSQFAQVQIAYRNPGRSAQVIALYVNGETGTRITFPPTGASSGAVWIQAKLGRPENKNMLNFATSPASGVKIDSVDVH